MMAEFDRSCFMEEEEVSSLEPMSCKWTDEMHSSYLKSMEASFVHQLYNSMDFVSWQPPKEQQSNERASTGLDYQTPSQFMIHQHGSRQYANYDTTRADGRTPASDHGSSANSRGNYLSAHGSNGFSNQFISTQLYGDSSNTKKEVSDQNFDQEDAVKPHNRGRRLPKGKKSRSNKQKR